MACNERCLVCECARRNGFWIEHGPQCGLALVQNRSTIGPFGFCHGLRWNRPRGEVKRFRAVPNMIDVLEAAVADHEGAGDRTGSVILGQDRAFRPLSIGGYPTANAMAGTLSSLCGPGAPVIAEWSGSSRLVTPVCRSPHLWAPPAPPIASESQLILRTSRTYPTSRGCRDCRHGRCCR